MGLRPKLNKLKNKPEQVSPKNAGRNVQTTLRKNVQRMFAYYTCSSVTIPFLFLQRYVARFNEKRRSLSDGYISIAPPKHSFDCESKLYMSNLRLSYLAGKKESLRRRTSFDSERNEYLCSESIKKRKADKRRGRGVDISEDNHPAFRS
ncbi:MAG: hypothetical protein LKI59_03855, partial [Bacteroidales bacterium]|jgi:hypothetical protein|nr:hypothetical protein [Bacteroidales bacterium]